MRREGKEGQVSKRTPATMRAKHGAYGGCRHTKAHYRRRLKHGAECRHDRPRVPQLWDATAKVWVK